MAHRVGRYLDSIAQSEQLVPADERMGRGAERRVPAIGAADLARHDEDACRKAFAPQDRERMFRRVRVTVIESDQHGPAGKRRCLGAPRVPLRRPDAFEAEPSKPVHVPFENRRRNGEVGEGPGARGADVVIDENRQRHAELALERLP